MQYTIKTIPISKIEFGEIQLSEQDQKEHQNLIRLTKTQNLRRLILVKDTGTELHFIAGTRQFQARKVLDLKETECIVFTDDPPSELVTLVEEFGRTDFNAVVEADCIKKLTTIKQFKKSALARMLGF